MIRLIQHKILMHQEKLTNCTEKWESGLSAERIQSALKSWCADSLPQGYYRLTRITEDLRLIFDAYGIIAPEKLPRETDIRSLKFSIAQSL